MFAIAVNTMFALPVGAVRVLTIVGTSAVRTCLWCTAAVAQVTPVLAPATLAGPGEVAAGREKERLDLDALVNQVVGRLLVIQDYHPASGLVARRESFLRNKPAHVHYGFW